ncbi:hypothetical protein HKX48_001992, partial [Thoreauomyces humboldtii]
MPPVQTSASRLLGSAGLLMEELHTSSYTTTPSSSQTPSSHNDHHHNRHVDEPADPPPPEPTGESAATVEVLPLLADCKSCRGAPREIDLGGIHDFPLSTLRSATQSALKSSAHGQPSRTPRMGNEWEFAGWGKTVVTRLLPDVAHLHGKMPDKLQMGQFRATAIAAISVTGGVLYTIGFAVTVAGQYAPISLLLTCIVVFIYRFIFAELGSIPLNGGVYSLLLVGSTKLVASMAACCMVLDLSASAVVAASTGANYFVGQWGHGNVYLVTVIVLVLFGFLALAGVKDSANLSTVIFGIHFVTMSMLLVATAVHWGQNGSDILIANWNAPSPTGNAPWDIFLGFCIGMLGFTGIETCPNYIEEQKPGVYSKVMRNIAYLVLAFMPTLAMGVLVVLPRAEIDDNVSFVLSHLGKAIGGTVMEMIVSVDACIVLCGGVLCSFVGIVGLMEHMANDHLLPRILLRTNRLTRSHHFIILTFLILCLLIVVITNGDLTLQSLLFAVSFLFVIGLFAAANLLLKYRRGRLHRTERVPWTAVVCGMAAVIAAIVGNSISSPVMLGVFAGFFGAILLAVLVVVYEVRILRFLVVVADSYAGLGNTTTKLLRWLKVARSKPVAFFTNHDEIHVLNKAVLYVAHNEPTMHLQMIHFFNDPADIPVNLESNCHILDHVYPKISIDLILVKGTFSPASVACMAKALGISRNQCYITCPGESVEHI